MLEDLVFSMNAALCTHVKRLGLHEKVKDIEETPTGFKGECPACGGLLGVRQNQDTRKNWWGFSWRVRLYCYDGCSEGEVCDALGLDAENLWYYDIEKALAVQKLWPRTFTPPEGASIEELFRVNEALGKLVQLGAAGYGVQGDLWTCIDEIKTAQEFFGNRYPAYLEAERLLREGAIDDEEYLRRILVRPEPASGAELVRQIEGFLVRYVVLPRYTVLPLALWCMMSYGFQWFDTVPYLLVSSPVMRCGKTRLVECMELLVHAPRRVSNISEAALFRVIEKEAPTLLLDEAETLSGKSERAEYLRQILNAGNRRGALVTRCVGQGTNLESQNFSVFCPKVLAGIGNFPQTITDRAVVIAMQRRKASERVERFLHRYAEPVGKALGQRAQSFVFQRKAEIMAAYEKAELEFISDRDAECWAPLFAILSAADSARLTELRECAERLTHAKSENAEDDSLSLRLLADIRSIWPTDEPKAFSAEIVTRLKAIEDAPWVDEQLRFDGRKMARMLRPFGMLPGTVRVGEDTKKGYFREQAEAAFSRYLGGQASHPSQPA